MNRRSFLRTATSTTIAGFTAAAAPQTSDQHQQGRDQQARAGDAPAGLYGPSATEAHFTESRLRAALGLDSPGGKLRKPSVEVVVFNFPSWHSSPYMEARFGKGWTEWDTLRNARTLFPGHTMPHYPLWGYFNEADPEWSAREIDLAVAHGIHAWMIDWYWHEGTQFYHEQIEQGLLRAPNRDKLKFAVMWANHDWKNVYPARSPNDAAILLPQVHTLPDFDRVANYCAEHYFKEPNYLRIDDAPVFAIFDCAKIIDQLGIGGLQEGLERMRKRAHALGFPALHLQTVGGYGRYASQLRTFGFDSATEYGAFGWTYGSRPPGSRTPYGIGAFEAAKGWADKHNSLPLPFFPCAQVGWDDSPRFEDFAAIAINRSPDQFECLVRAARHSVADAKRPIIYVTSWNEWTEDHVLLPDSIWGYSYLEALQRAAHD
ncbi:glycoside hydrolase family 99-like domain-containing protein [Silvibacterium acidisoli]|uniref:glycoside hydrolase family 99-like domain-containing protein n=1 Tax=Acidobacteriaceae bacterium ZG23-2 TaxID=2883246 RepID=UPI00406CA3A1